jgi:hypothetical protein
MNAASIPQAKSTLKRSLFSPIEGDLLPAFRDTGNQILSPVFVRTKEVGSLFAETALRIALEISRRATKTGQRTSESTANGNRAVPIERSNVPKFVMRARSPTRPKKRRLRLPRNPQISINVSPSTLMQDPSTCAGFRSSEWAPPCHDANPRTRRYV